MKTKNRSKKCNVHCFRKKNPNNEWCHHNKSIVIDQPRSPGGGRQKNWYNNNPSRYPESGTWRNWLKILFLCPCSSLPSFLPPSLCCQVSCTCDSGNVTAHNPFLFLKKKSWFCSNLWVFPNPIEPFSQIMRNKSMI